MNAETLAKAILKEHMSWSNSLDSFPDMNNAQHVFSYHEFYNDLDIAPDELSEMNADELAEVESKRQMLIANALSIAVQKWVKILTIVNE